VACLDSNGRYQIAAKGSIGTNLDVTPSVTTSDYALRQMIFHAPLATDAATLKIYKDAVSAANLLFDGYFANRDKDNSIRFPQSEVCTTKFIVVSSGGSGDLVVLARYD